MIIHLLERSSYTSQKSPMCVALKSGGGVNGKNRDSAQAAYERYCAPKDRYVSCMFASLVFNAYDLVG